MLNKTPNTPGHTTGEAQATPAGGRRRRGHSIAETQGEGAAAAPLANSNALDRKVEGKRRRGQTSGETHAPAAAATPPSPLQTLCDAIRSQHRDRRFSMKQQQKMDRSLESYIRREFTAWSPDLPRKRCGECRHRFTGAMHGRPPRQRVEA
jgi:hypothetical protein